MLVLLRVAVKDVIIFYWLCLTCILSELSMCKVIVLLIQKVLIQAMSAVHKITCLWEHLNIMNGYHY